VSGVSLRYAFPSAIDGLDFEKQILPSLGTVGLILIVLEGTLELELSQAKLPIIKKTFWAAFYQLFFSVGLIAFLFTTVLQCSVLQALINATPFAVVSSAIAIPSAEGLSAHRREFIIYESTFSDILGIMLFNLLLNWADVGWWATVNCLLSHFP
jgi:potassium/hydrogen antiporter